MNVYDPKETYKGQLTILLYYWLEREESKKNKEIRLVVKDLITKIWELEHEF